MRRGRGRRTQEPSAEGSGNIDPEGGILERLAQMFGRGREEAPRDIVKEARDKGATKFHGTTNPTEAMSWLAEMDQILTEGIVCSDEEKVRVASFLLRDNARKWWVTKRAAGDLTWEQFKDVFKTHFCPPSFINRKRMEFERLRQGDMSVTDYEAKFLELAEYAPELLTSEGQKMFRFTEGLKQEIHMHLTGVPHPSYESVRDAALELERRSYTSSSGFRGKQKKRQNEYSGYGSSSQGSSKRGSYSSGSSGGSSGNRRNWQNSSGSRFQRGGQSQYSSQASGASSGGGQTRQPCGNCGRYHLGECRYSNTLVCYGCGQPGHLKRNCPYQDANEGSNQEILNQGNQQQQQQQYYGENRGQGSQASRRNISSTSEHPQQSGQSSRGRNQRGRSASRGRVFNMTQQEAQRAP